MEVEPRASDLALVRWLASRPSGYTINTALRDRSYRTVFKKIKTALQKEHPDEKIADTDVSDKVHDAIWKSSLGIISAYWRKSLILMIGRM